MWRTWLWKQWERCDGCVEDDATFLPGICPSGCVLFSLAKNITYDDIRSEIQGCITPVEVLLRGAARVRWFRGLTVSLNTQALFAVLLRRLLDKCVLVLQTDIASGRDGRTNDLRPWAPASAEGTLPESGFPRLRSDAPRPQMAPAPAGGQQGRHRVRSAGTHLGAGAGPASPKARGPRGGTR